jgi:hypothetical protein
MRATRVLQPLLPIATFEAGPPPASRLRQNVRVPPEAERKVTVSEVGEVMPAGLAEEVLRRYAAREAPRAIAP